MHGIADIDATAAAICSFEICVAVARAAAAAAAESVHAGRSHRRIPAAIAAAARAADRKGVVLCPARATSAAAGVIDGFARDVVLLTRAARTGSRRIIFGRVAADLTSAAAAAAGYAAIIIVRTSNARLANIRGAAVESLVSRSLTAMFIVRHGIGRTKVRIVVEVAITATGTAIAPSGQIPIHAGLIRRVHIAITACTTAHSATNYFAVLG